MKMKRWLSRGIVLAMVVALMVPMPVLAKGGKSGGKLVKSVTEYTYRHNRWEKVEKTAYAYDKKNNPKEITSTYYGNHVLGIPMAASNEVLTAKYKYKGKTPKSMKLKNTAGVVVATYKYKKGRVVSYTDTEVDSNFVNDVEVVETRKTTGSVSYNKKGLAVARAENYTATFSDGSAPVNRNDSYNYAVTHKKGVPSLILETYPETYEEPVYDEDGNETGTKKVTEMVTMYTKFNKKGLTTETGYVDKATGAYKPYYTVGYTKKKGKITQAIVYDIETNEAGAVTKSTPLRMYKFKYGKKKISAVRYLSMMNSLVGYHNAFFSWY